VQQNARTRLRGAVAVAASAAALWATAATPLRALDELPRALGAGTDPFAAVVPAAALLAWVLALWLAGTVALTAAGQLPGAIGRCACGAARRVAPSAVRRAVELALGLTLAAGAACASPAAAAPSSDRAPGSAVSLPAVQAPSLDWPTGGRPAPTPPPPPAAAAAAAAPSSGGEVVVAPGDTLWALAERSLGPSATTEQVAAAWPAWWAANREVVGADPHLIHPGDRLTPPAAHS
jgi:nucleoid-associated protein YgaU